MKPSAPQWPHLLHHLITIAADADPDAEALAYQAQCMTYGELGTQIRQCAGAYLQSGLARGDRVAIYLEKRFENVVALFAAAMAGGVFVPINPLLKPEQVAYILADCNVRVLVTSAERLATLAPLLPRCPDLRTIVVAGKTAEAEAQEAGTQDISLIGWNEAMDTSHVGPLHRVIDTDIAAILYTSGSTGKPKGVVLSHRNVVAGALSVAQYLENRSGDRILAALPLSFDAGFSQLTTAFHAGARVTLLNHLFARDVLNAVVADRITGLTAVPALWIQLAQLKWPPGTSDHLRYIANTGGHMPKATLERLRAALPRTQPFLMYGLTESFRSTFLPPSELDRRPDSIGKAIPNAEVLVVREDGTPCDPDEPGELVHRGALVALGYWNDPAKTAERFKPAPGQPAGLTMPEIAVWSGDTVRIDEDGYIYFISRRDEMIKTSGYRVSPTEVEEIVYGTGLVAETAALGIAHPTLGQAIVVVATPRNGAALDVNALLRECRQRLPAFMVPALIQERTGNLPRNPNGKIDRRLIAEGMHGLFEAKS
ncbi:MAG: acyl-CoA ligase (AMP-forming), exosortase A system-associated [Casimicrobiaceae bacterium]